MGVYQDWRAIDWTGDGLRLEIVVCPYFLPNYGSRKVQEGSET
jgi:hypothetical protein